MSYVTNVLVIGDKDTDHPIFAPRTHKVTFDQELNLWKESYGGSKRFEWDCYGGAINFLDFREFAKTINEIDWHSPADVRIIIQDQEDYFPTMYTLAEFVKKYERH